VLEFSPVGKVVPHALPIGAITATPLTIRIVAGTELKTTMTAYRLLRLGLGVALIVLLIGVIAAYLNIPGAFEIIWAALLAVAALTAVIARNLKPPQRPQPPPPPQQNGRVGVQ